ncbi:MAG: hypothetical protein HY332_00585 [Chloroflexi bacterium]|nr:hypothetical protein [Chloroflexota bacterium]
MADFEPNRLVRTLYDEGVAFIIIGGIAASFLGSPSATFDLDICYERSRENLEALARALRSLNAKLRGIPEDVPFRLDARTLAMGDHFTFATDAGDFDCLGTPAGTDGYEDLLRNVVDVEVEGIPIKVAGLDDLIRMKRASGRPKDRIELEILGALRDEIDREPE